MQGQHTLLRTKLFVPPSAETTVARPALVARLNRGVNGPITLVAAPAGSGKTTLVAAWLRDSTFPWPTARRGWYALDPTDQDPYRFLAYLAAAATPPGTAPRHTAQLLLSEPPLPIDTLVDTFLNELTAAEQPTILVLDDYHVVQSPAIHTVLSRLVLHPSPQAHLVVISRADPALPLSRLRARRQLTEIRAADLRLSVAESAALLNERLGLALTMDNVTMLAQRTEGWAAGLQLAALSLQSIPARERGRFVANFSGDDRFVLDYLLDEVLGGLTAAQRRFLLVTAVADRFCAPLCAALLAAAGEPATVGAVRAQIAQLERRHLFLVPLDNRREWFRFHHLFRDLLRSQLAAADPDLPEKLHRRAAGWFAERASLREALSHAHAVSDGTFAAELLASAAPACIVHGELTTLADLADRLAPAQVTARPQLAIFVAWAATSLLRLNAAERALNQVAAWLDTQPADGGDFAAQADIVRGLLASKRLDLRAAAHWTRRGLAGLQANRPLLAGLAASNLAILTWLAGRTPDAVTQLEAAAAQNLAAGNVTEAILLYGMTAQATFDMGRLSRTERICRDALALVARHIADNPNRPLPVAGFLYVQLAQLYREWNRLDEAVALVNEGIALAQTESIGNLLMLHVLLALLHQAQGAADAAEAAAARVAATAAQLPVTGVMTQIADFQVFYHLRAGHPDKVDRWASALGLSPSDEPSHLAEPRYLIFAEHLVRQGRTREADTLLTTLRRVTREAGRHGRTLLTLILSAQLAARRRDEDAASAWLREALALGLPDQHTRAFLDGGPTVARLLRRLALQPGPLCRYRDYLVSLSVDAPKTPTTPSDSPLSPRELQVLALAAAGHTNRAIAAELHLAIGTVKRHLSNIYGKLGVSSRTQAIARAREQSLLQ